MGKLAEATQAAAPAERSRFADVVGGARHFEEMAFPRTELRLAMRVLTRAESQRVDLETRRYMADIGFEQTFSTAEEYNAEKAMRTLQIACRDADDRDRPLASVDEWRDEADDDQIAALWEAYDDMRQRIDPRPEELTEAEFEEMMGYWRKKPEVSLASWKGFGAHKLALFVRTMASQSSNSPTPRSSDSPSPAPSSSRA